MKKLLLMSLLFALTVGCVTPKADILVPAREYTKREYKENREPLYRSVSKSGFYV